MANWFKRNGIHLAIAGVFLLMCFVYFSPAIQGKVLPQHDVQQAEGTQAEIMRYKELNGKGPLWTNAMFGGMPAFQIWTQYPSNVASYVIDFFTHTFPSPVYFVLIYLLGAYLLFNVLGVKPLLAFAGSVAFAFTSYNFILIQAGHNNQALAIGFFAPILAGILLTFRQKYIQGAALSALALAVEIRANHIQMTYYLMLAILILVGIEAYHAFKAKATAPFFKALGYLAAATVLAIGVNAGSLWTTYEYGQLSQRGKSNLTADKGQGGNGLSRDYAYQWSQGVGENITFLVPNAYGGASSSQLDGNSEVAKTLTQRGVPADQAADFARRLPTYWGEKQFTAGPFYFGAVVFFLYILGLFIVRNRLKWWILSATVLCLLLSFGRHFPFVSDIFFNYFPLYNKFRAVESIIAVVGLLFPVLAVLAVNEIIERKADSKELLKKLMYTAYVTGGLLLLVLAVPTLLLSFRTSGHDDFVKALTQGIGGDASFAGQIAAALVQDRIGLARADAFRSLLFVIVAFGLTWALIKSKLSPAVTFGLFAVAILVDLWSVDRRYLNNDSFVEKSQLTQAVQPRQVDQLILRDTSPDYRVLDLSGGDPFSDARPSNFFKSLGGYHSAKLKRFQEVLEKQLNYPFNEDVLDMMNVKYAITNSEDQQTQTIKNRSTACGPVWLVPHITYVKNADQEMAAISSFDPKKEAFVDQSFKPLIDESKLGADPNAFIKMTHYSPDTLRYEYSAGKDVFAVFSEVYYDKGWNAYVDGTTKIPLIRADYLLRAAQLPGGNHRLELRFEPTSYAKGELISLVASILLVAALGFAIFLELTQNRIKNILITKK